MNETYFKKRSDFSEAHYKLGRTPAMFDIDVMVGEWLNLDENRGTKQEATFIEYKCLKFEKDENRFNDDRIKFNAVFELKYKGTKRVKSSMTLNPGEPLWAAFMLAKKLNSRFFLVVATDGQSPFYFFEYDIKTNKMLEMKVLNFDYQIDDPKVIQYFWKNELNLIN